MVAFGADNASVNYGIHNSVYQKLLIENPKLIKANCLCHVFHNMGKYARVSLKYNVENLVVQVYNEFSTSSKNVEKLKDIHDFLETGGYRTFFKHINIRWLSLSNAIDRLLLNWDAAKSYFITKGKKNVDPSIWKFLSEQESGISDDVTFPECYIYFMQHYTNFVSTAVRNLEDKATSICDVYGVVHNLKLGLESRIEKEFFGSIVNNALLKLDPLKAVKFKKQALDVYQRSLDYLQKWFSFENSPLKFFANLSVHEQSNLESYKSCFDLLGIDVDTDKLFDELIKLDDVMKKIPQELGVYERWRKFFNIVESPQLYKLICSVFSIPISNAEVERLFSIMNNLWGDDRNKLRIQLVKAEICTRVNIKMKCAEFAKFIKSEKSLLAHVKSTEKYSFKNTTNTT